MGHTRETVKAMVMMHRDRAGMGMGTEMGPGMEMGMELLRRFLLSLNPLQT